MMSFAISPYLQVHDLSLLLILTAGVVVVLIEQKMPPWGNVTFLILGVSVHFAINELQTFPSRTADDYFTWTSLLL
jgi:hypothetical protein